MTDRKTAAELRAMASVSLQPGWRSLCVHLAAVEEERERADEAVAYEERIAALTGDREKVGEWWEVRHPCSPFIPKRWTTRELARGTCSEGGKVVHVTRWRKR